MKESAPFVFWRAGKKRVPAKMAAYPVHILYIPVLFFRPSRFCRSIIVLTDTNRALTPVVGSRLWRSGGGWLAAR